MDKKSAISDQNASVTRLAFLYSLLSHCFIKFTSCFSSEPEVPTTNFLAAVVTVTINGHCDINGYTMLGMNNLIFVNRTMWHKSI